MPAAREGTDLMGACTGRVSDDEDENVRYAVLLDWMSVPLL